MTLIFIVCGSIAGGVIFWYENRRKTAMLLVFGISVAFTIGAACADAWDKHMDKIEADKDTAVQATKITQLQSTLEFMSSQLNTAQENLRLALLNGDSTKLDVRDTRHDVKEVGKSIKPERPLLTMTYGKEIGLGPNPYLAQTPGDSGKSLTMYFELINGSKSNAIDIEWRPIFVVWNRQKVAVEQLHNFIPLTNSMAPEMISGHQSQTLLNSSIDSAKGIRMVLLEFRYKNSYGELQPTYKELFLLSGAKMNQQLEPQSVILVNMIDVEMKRKKMQ